MLLALCPSVDVARSRAITACGATASAPGYALADKRIPRGNLLPPCLVQWNRRWAERSRRAQRGNAIRVVGVAAKASADQRLRRRKARMERQA